MATNDSEVTPEEKFNRSLESLATLESLNYSFQGMLSVAVVLLILVVATAFGNFLVGLSLVRYRSLRTVSNYLIGNLAVSDFLLAITVLPLSTLDECLGRWVLGRAICNLWLVIDVMYCTASIWNILVIALDRYTATVFPLWYRERRSPRQAAVYVATVWFVAVATCVPPLLGWNSLNQNYVYVNATASFHCVLFQSPSYVVYSACFSFYAPFLVTFFLYLRIFVVLRKRLRRMRKTTETHRTSVRTVAKKTTVSAAIRPTILLPSGLEMTSRTPPDDDGGDDGTSKSPLTSDSDDVEGFESLTVTTIYSPSSPISVAHHLPSQPPPSASSGLTLPCTGSHNNGFEDFQVEATPRSNNGGLLGVPRRRLELSGKSRSTMDFLSPSIGVFDQRWRAKSCHLDAASEDKDKLSSVRRAQKNGSPRPRSRRTGRAKPGSQRKTGRYDRREMRATVRMAIIIGVFCGMWIGFFTVYVYKGLCLDCYVPRSLEAFFFWLGYSNSAVNPILYTIFNEEFRKAFQKILGCSRRNKSTITKR